MSAVGPFPTSGLIERLVAQVPLAKLVGTAADLDTAMESPPTASPALFVLVEERGGDAKYTGDVTVQNAAVQIKVVRLVRSAAGQRHGTGARVLADQVIAEIRRGLIGWTPDDAFEAITFVAGRDDRYRAGWLAGQEIFRTAYRIQNQAIP